MRQLRRWLIGAWMVALVMSSSVSWAQQSDPSDDQSDDQKAVEYFERGAEHYYEGNYSRALLEFRRAYSFNKNASILYNMSLAHLKLNNHKSALETARRADKRGGMPAGMKVRNDARIQALNARLRSETVAAEILDQKQAAQAAKEREAKAAKKREAKAAKKREAKAAKKREAKAAKEREAKAAKKREAKAAEGTRDQTASDDEKTTSPSPARASSQADPDPPSRASDSSEGGLGALGWTGVTMSVAGASVLVYAALLNQQLSSDIDSYKQASNQGRLGAYEQHRQDIADKQSLGKVALYSGAGLTAVGLTLWVIDGVSTSPESSGDLSVEVNPGVDRQMVYFKWLF